jgi:hypothetical protein
MKKVNVEFMVAASYENDQNYLYIIDIIQGRYLRMIVRSS